MNNAIIFIKDDKELELAKTKLLGKSLIEYTVFELNKLDLDSIYLIGGKELSIEGVLNRDDIKDLSKDLGRESGKTLIVTPLYPLVDKKLYVNLLSKKEGAVMLDEDKLCISFMLPNKKIKNFENVNLKSLEMIETNQKRLKDFGDIPTLTENIKLKINIRLVEMGVNIIDPYATYIGQDVVIDRNTVIYPNVFIEGKCLIGKNNVITSGTHLINVIIGDNNNIKNSTISDSIVHDNTMVGPYAQLRNNAEIFNNVRVGNYVEIKNSKIGEHTNVAHLAYIGDATVGHHVNFGCGAITINYDGSRKYQTIIKDHAFIGSNANLIAPVTIGEYGMVAAGSTVNSDVIDGDMAISRLYQTNKKGYGYRYIKKEN